MTLDRYDLAIVGAGILGLGAAVAATRQGLKTIVIDRDAQANGASVRNFGFVTVTGQAREAMWARARRSRDVWIEVATAAGIPILQTGMWMSVRRPESVQVLEAFLRTDMAEGCRLLSPAEARAQCPALPMPQCLAVLDSRIELRVESREAIPRLAAWLAEARHVHFLRNTAVLGIDSPRVDTSTGSVHAERVIVCPGDDFTALYAKRLSNHALKRCQLQMMRLANPGFILPAAVMSDLGLGRYAGYSALPPAQALKHRLQTDQPDHLAQGVHLIVVQSADGSLVVGDSHHYAATPPPFSRQEVDALILDEFRAALGIEPPPVIERWTGTYASSEDRSVLIDAPHPDVRIAIVTSGAGASTAFAIGEELIASLFESGART